MGRTDSTAVFQGKARPSASRDRNHAADVFDAGVVQLVGRGGRGRDLRQLRPSQVRRDRLSDGTSAGRDNANAFSPPAGRKPVGSSHV